jgi:filamentous hemagglutinin
LLPLLAVAAVGGLVGGVGYYALQMYFNHDPCARWEWKEAVFWGGVGTGLGALLGVGIYGGWWVGAQLGWWGTVASGTTVAQQVNQRTSGVWQLPPFQRGTTIHQMLGENLPPNFPVIDRFMNGTATSIKTLNLSASTYQNIASLISKVQGYINSLVNFQGAQRLQAPMIAARELVLAIPAGTSTPAQWAALQGLQQYAANLGITLTIVQIP